MKATSLEPTAALEPTAKASNTWPKPGGDFENYFLRAHSHRRTHSDHQQHMLRPSGYIEISSAEHTGTFEPTAMASNPCSNQGAILENKKHQRAHSDSQQHMTQPGSELEKYFPRAHSHRRTHSNSQQHMPQPTGYLETRDHNDRPARPAALYSVAAAIPFS